jgi:hypothetical protein
MLFCGYIKKNKSLKVTSQEKKRMKSTFEEIRKRINQETGIETLKELAEMLGKKPNFMTRKRKENIFNANWAVEIGKKYKISTDWILTGEGIKRKNSGTENPYAVKLAKWMETENEKDNRAAGAIEMTIETALPEFKKWLDKN